MGGADGARNERDADDEESSLKMTTENLLVELFVEELPPKALKKLGDAFAHVLADSLKAQGLAASDAVVTAFASPRRLAAHVTQVSRKAADKAVQQKLMPVAVGLDASGHATPALLKKLQALGADVSDPVALVAALKRAPDGKAEALFFDSLVTGAGLDLGLQKALDDAIAKLPIPKVMSYQLETNCGMDNFLPGWTSVHFVRPAHGLVALHGSTVVPVKALGLTSGNSTQGHRFEARLSPVVIGHANAYAATLGHDGAVIASFDERRFSIVTQLANAAEQLGPGYQVLMDDDLRCRQTDPQVPGGQQHQPGGCQRRHWRQRARGAPAPERCQVLLRPGPQENPRLARGRPGQSGLPQQAGQPGRAHQPRARHGPSHWPPARR